MGVVVSHADVVVSQARSLADANDRAGQRLTGRTSPWRHARSAAGGTPGVFLAGGLCHLLPEATVAFDNLPKEWAGIFPEHFSFTCCGIGFMLTLLLERVVLADGDDASGKKQNLKDSDDEGVELSSIGHSHGHSHGAVVPFLHGRRGARHSK